ncbi:hypothetical protein N7445_005436 [Penicillium cf. griseofulvum]|nr:hypothetical protein N7445_005436 [Penicillium cf. griseofulvum]
MEPAEVEANIDVDDDGLAPIQTNPVIPFVLPSIESGFYDDPFVTYPTRTKRKRGSMTTTPQKCQATERNSPLPWYKDPAHCNSGDRTPNAIDETILTYGISLPFILSICSQIIGRATHPNLVSTPEPEDPEDFIQFARDRRSHAIAREIAPMDLTELPDISPRTTPNTRVWGSHRPSNLNFTIYQDPPDQQTPNPSPLQEDFHAEQEDKENVFVTRSDISSSDEEEETQPNLAWDEASTGPRDAFGLPLNREMSDFVQPRDTLLPERHMRRGREVLRTIWVDVAQATEEEENWLRDGSLTDTQIREIEDIEASYQRGQISRFLSNRHQALRDDATVQAPTNFNTDIRRALHFQRHEGRAATAEDSPAPPETPQVPPEENEELQQENQQDQYQ